VKHLGVILLCCAGLSLWGEVYWRDPASSGGGSGALRRDFAENELEFTVAYQEPMEFNGVEMTLEAGQAREVYESFLRRLLYRGGRNIRLGGNGFFADYPQENGFVRRYLVIDLGNFPAVIFRMVVPNRLTAPPAWPHAFGKLPAGAKVETVIRFSQRGLLYGSFSGAGPRSLSLGQLERSFVGDGWRPVSGELSRPHAKGEIFVKDGQILWFSADDAGNGVICRRKESVKP